MGEACRRLCGFEDSFRSVRTRAENRFMMERFARLLPVSDYVRDVMVGNGFDPAGLRVARNFTRVAPVTAAVDPNRVLFVGRPTPEKGLLELVRAVGRTSAKPVLHIVGGGSAAWSGPYLGEVASEASRLGVRVERQDWCVGAELALAYARSSVVAFPSVWPEPFGLVGIEAMAHGKPVVAFSCGGVREWAGPETAFTHPVGDIGAFAGSLDRLLGDRSLRERMGEAARAEAARRFSADAYMDRLLGLYAEVVNGSGERNGESTADRSRRRPALRYA
jgi:glycosyltransferase involved in cell wall biosynthesis